MELTIDQALQQGVAAQKEGKLQDAERFYRAILQVQPSHPHANHNLGVLTVSVGKTLEAIPLFRHALEASPHIEQFWISYVEALVESGHAHGIISATEFTQKFPDIASAWLCLGSALGKAGRMQESIDALGHASKLSPSDVRVHYNLGVALTKVGNFKPALECYQRALILNPSHAGAGYNSGNILIRLGKLEEAEIAFKQVILKHPHHVSARCNLGALLTRAGKAEEAAELLRESIEINPTHAESHSNLGDALKELGEHGQAEFSYRKAVSLDPSNFPLHSNLAMLSASMLSTLQPYLSDLRRFSDEIHSKICEPFSEWLASKDPADLRVGFVSGDFRSHPVGYFLERLLMELQSSSVELFAYPTTSESDAITSRTKPLFDMWSPLVGLDDDAAAQKIHGDGIHILIDLSGHTAKNRLPIFARKPAPIQVSWLGYFASTGLPEMDYILGDPYVTPHKEADHFVETIWQLPESYLCFTPPSDDVRVAPLPASINGFITFGCFNSLARMTDEVVAVRAAILHAVPDSKLFLKDKQLGHEAGRSRVLSRFAALDIGADRLILEGKSPRKEYLACYNRVDIALSPFPYGGGTTSVEGLWMGVPVMTKKGNHFLSHLGESIAHNSGLSDWIAVDGEEYVAKAVAFASDLESLSVLRKGMREQILNTPLFDAPRFARHFEEALRAMRSKLV